MQVQRERSLRASPAAPQPLIIMITLDSCTELFLRLDSHNTIFGCAKRTKLTENQGFEGPHRNSGSSSAAAAAGARGGAAAGARLGW